MNSPENSAPTPGCDVALLNRRAAVVHAIGEIKKTQGIGVVDAGREATHRVPPASPDRFGSCRGT